MAIRGIIFDLGGVIVRTEDQEPRRRLAERLGMQVKELYDLVFEAETARKASLGLGTQAEHMAYLRERLGLTPQDFE
ncbi:MAG: hypothetical protein L0Z70_07825, partial [Chloroflexi bacterium]|nr:hypothetical protein [Chloroflexota bacterium]